MNIQTLTPKILNHYSCQSCQKVVESEKELKIESYFSPVCSFKCFFRVVYHFLKKQGISYNIILFYVLNPYTSFLYEIKSPQSQSKELYFDNAKLLTKWFLSNVKGGLSLYQSFIISS